MALPLLPLLLGGGASLLGKKLFGSDPEQEQQDQRVADATALGGLARAQGIPTTAALGQGVAAQLQSGLGLAGATSLLGQPGVNPQVAAQQQQGLLTAQVEQDQATADLLGKQLSNQQAAFDLQQDFAGPNPMQAQADQLQQQRDQLAFQKDLRAFEEDDLFSGMGRRGFSDFSRSIEFQSQQLDALNNISGAIDQFTPAQLKASPELLGQLEADYLQSIGTMQKFIEENPTALREGERDFFEGIIRDPKAFFAQLVTRDAVAVGAYDTFAQRLEDNMKSRLVGLTEASKRALEPSMVPRPSKYLQPANSSLRDPRPADDMNVPLPANIRADQLARSF